jgi:hypothetical protein
MDEGELRILLAKLRVLGRVRGGGGRRRGLGEGRRGGGENPTLTVSYRLQQPPNKNHRPSQTNG